MEIDAKKLQLAMARKCMGTKELAASTGCTTRSIQQIVSGNRGVPIKKLGKIAKALEVDPETLLIN
nr:MAG TPA: helix-turn-helix domain protein [Caudoviricetes sp.]